MTAKGRASAVFSQAAATVAVLIGSFIAANSAVASANLFECQEMNRDSHDLGIAMDKLTVKVVEHITPNPVDLILLDDDDIRSLNLADIDLQTDAPKLSLSPRVATMLDRIFEVDQPPAKITESDTAGLTSPIADGPIGKEAPEDSRDFSADEEVRLPQLQRSMNRRDI